MVDKIGVLPQTKKINSLQIFGIIGHFTRDTKPLNIIKNCLYLGYLCTNELKSRIAKVCFQYFAFSVKIKIT